MFCLVYALMLHENEFSVLATLLGFRGRSLIIALLEQIALADASQHLYHVTELLR